MKQRKIPLPANDWLEALGYVPGDAIRFYTDATGEIIGIAPRCFKPVDEGKRIT